MLSDKCYEYDKIMNWRGRIYDLPFLSFNDNIAFVGEPYWEIYHVKVYDPNGEYVDCERFLFKQHEEMMNRVNEIISTYSLTTDSTT
jgi:hypothetical protein